LCAAHRVPAMARLTPFDVGQIKAHAFHGLGPASIARSVEKTAGASPSEQRTGDVSRKLTPDPEWRGERQAGSGRRRATPRRLDKHTGKEVLRLRGKVSVNVACVQKKFPATRGVSRTCLDERLHDAGLVYLRRRKKTLVPTVYNEERLAFAQSVMRMHTSSLGGGGRIQTGPCPTSASPVYTWILHTAQPWARSCGAEPTGAMRSTQTVSARRYVSNRKGSRCASGGCWRMVSCTSHACRRDTL
jgi:hypothetical protein